MKKTLLFCCLLINSFQLISQNSCSSPLYFAPDTGMVHYLNIDYPNSDFNIDYGCFTSVPDTSVTWVFLQICSSGNLDLALTPVNSAADIDFVVYGPVTTPFSCDYTQNEIVACSFNFNTTIENFSVNNCQVGEVYLIAISNYMNVLDQYRLERTGGATICPIGYQSITQINKSKVKLYPNPSDNIVFIDDLPAAASWKYYIYSIDGKKVKEGLLSVNYIEVSDLKKGIYSVKFINTNQKMFLSKFLKI